MKKKKIKSKRIFYAKKNLLLIFVALLLFTTAVSFGRYTWKKILDLYFTSKNFYFESDKLKSTEAVYSLDYWNGVDPYEIVINLNSFKNSRLKSDSDITYTITYSCPSTVLCTSSKESGTIYSNTNTDSFVFIMTPNAPFQDNDTVTVYIQADATSPYEKTLSASFTFKVGTYGLSHEITDASNDLYLLVKVTNTLDSYFVKEAFDSYSIGDTMSSDTYASLSDTNKAKCASAVITMEFDPNVLHIDNNNTNYLKAYNIVTESINSYNYVNKFTYDMDSSTSSIVKFYKVDPTQNYNGSNIVTVTYEY